MITVYRLTKYSSGCPAGWNKSFEKSFEKLEEAQKYALRQHQLLTQFEGMFLEEHQVQTGTAFYIHACGTEVKLCMRGWLK